MDSQTCAQVLLSSKEKILEHIQTISIDDRFKYETFGKSIEPYVIEKLVEIFTEKGIVTNENDYCVALNKNDFPDFTLLSSTPALAIEIKVGNHSHKKKSVWKPCKNSNNDLGTLNKWPEKLKRFEGDNIYFLFIEYNFNDIQREILLVEIDLFYKFIGRTNNVMKYREKDGNLRPKNFGTPAVINSFAEFENLIDPTKIYRARRIILKHLRELSQTDRVNLLSELNNPITFEIVPKAKKPRHRKSEAVEQLTMLG